jgi:hypothetical protein
MRRKRKKEKLVVGGRSRRSSTNTGLDETQGRKEQQHSTGRQLDETRRTPDYLFLFNGKTLDSLE